MYKPILLALLTCGAWTSGLAQNRLLKPSDVYRTVSVGSPKVSPDGQWALYSVSRTDSAKDARTSDLWLSSLVNDQTFALTFSEDGEGQPEWSPDGKYISFTAKKAQDAVSQIYALDRRGGEAQPLTKLKKGSISDYAWSPDGKKIVLALTQAADTSKSKTPKPIVVNRFQFKRDGEGYIRERKTHLYLWDLASQKLDTLTHGDFNETSPIWSPDGQYIAFVSNRTPDPDRNNNTDLFVMEAKAKALPKQITTWTGQDSRPVWSPDSKKIAYLRSTSSDDYFMYDQTILCVVSKDGGEPKVLTQKLDRPVANPIWTQDGQSILFTVTDDRTRYVAQVPAAGGTIKPVVQGERTISSLELIPTTGSWVALVADPTTPAEVYQWKNNQLVRVTFHQKSFVEGIQLAQVSGFTSTSKDGTKVSNILYRSPKIAAGQKAPTIFFIHGGPTAQDEYSFDMIRQQLAAAGFHVVAVNYRGSNGRGLAFNKAISADWGNLEVQDIHGAVDYLVAQGIADPEKLGIGGWSYGGILTNYCIATDTRFKAGASGAGVAMISSMYGVDQYIQQYENELGAPWKNFDKYVALSYPFLKADRIKTPTQFMVGESDSNVPAVGSEQMYQALKSLGIPTELIVYPGQFHGISKPSYQKDRIERYVAWFSTYLK